MERINLNLGIPGREKQNPVWVPPTLADVETWINNRPYDDYTKAELIKSAKMYPGNALREFVRNINVQIARIQNQRKQDSTSDQE